MPLASRIREIVNKFGDVEADFGPPMVRHSVYKRFRQDKIARLAAEFSPGDLVEIGVRKGLTAVIIASVAEDADRNYIAVDPWTGNYARDRADFEARMRPWAGRIEVLINRAEDPEVDLSRPLAYAYLDGDHSYESMLAALEKVKHAAVIAIDDIHNSKGVKRLWRNAQDYGVAIEHQYVREGYIVTRDLKAKKPEDDRADSPDAG